MFEQLSVMHIYTCIVNGKNEKKIIQCNLINCNAVFYKCKVSKHAYAKILLILDTLA